MTKRFTSLGYDVRRTKVSVPAGDSWGVPVDAGVSYNVIADPPGFDPTKRYRIVGAHLDSVAVSPGAEDNASGTATMLELARMASEQPPATPVRFIAFGAEEPRGESDDMHHFGSTKYVRAMPRAERANLAGMVALDRVGVRASAVPICNGGPNGLALRRGLGRAAQSAGVPASTCEDRASDHWSFEKAGLPAARLGSVPYAGYHSAQDLPRLVDERQVRRVGRIMWRWLGARPDLGPSLFAKLFVSHSRQ
ncbi:MAG: M28 family peptidase, partial [Actinomycetia bacterium]|nr:M28 family peptidase [Actinomycetes bacterium]